MMSLRKPRLSKKQVIVIASIAAGVLLLGGLTWWLLSQKATNDYKSARTNYNQAATRALTDVSNNAFKEASDYDKRIAAFQNLSQATTAWKNNRPAAPNVLGIS